MPAGKYFVDTNVLLYSFDQRHPDKQEAAVAWLATLWVSEAGALNWQVLHEFYVNALRLRVDISEARLAVSRFRVWKPLAPDFELIERAWHWTDTAQVPWWDALILASAERLNCRYLLTEDFQAGRQFGTIQVISPFQSTPPVLA